MLWCEAYVLSCTNSRHCFSLFVLIFWGRVSLCHSAWLPTRSPQRGSVTTGVAGTRYHTVASLCLLRCCFVSTERVQVWLLELAASAAPPAGAGRYRRLSEAAEKSYRFSSGRTFSCGCFLSPPFLFSITLPAMDLLQESPRAVSAERLAAHHHPRLLPSEPARHDDEELEDRHRVPGL